jgi:MFS family permease
MTTAATTWTRPRWYHGWNIVAVCVLSQVAALGLTLNCFSLFLAQWDHDFHTKASTLEGAVLAFALVCAGVAPVAGTLADRVPARWIFGPAIVGLFVFHAAMGFATATWQVIALYTILLPVAVTFSTTVTAQAVVSRWFVRRVGLAMGLTAFGLAISGIVLPPIVNVLLPALGWRHVWWLFAGLIGLVILPTVVGVLRDRPDPEEGKDYVGDHLAPGGAPRAHGHGGGAKMAPGALIQTIKGVLTRPNFWITISVFIPVFCGYQAVVLNLTPIVTTRGFSVTYAAFLISLLSIADIIAKLGAGVLADKLGNRIPLMAVGLIGAAGLGLLALSGHQAPLMVVGLVLIGLSGGVWTLLASATAAEFGAEGFGTAFGLISALVPLGALAPPILAHIQESTGSYVPGLLGLAVFSLVGAAAGLLLKERTRAKAVA